MVSILRLILSPSTLMGPWAERPGITPARRASSTSWLTYAIRSATRTISPSLAPDNLAGMVEDAVPDLVGEFRPCSFSRTSTTAEMLVVAETAFMPLTCEGAVEGSSRCVRRGYTEVVARRWPR